MRRLLDMLQRCRRRNRAALFELILVSELI